MRAQMNTRVKICGLTRARDVEAAILHGADMLGFIVEAKSKRRLSVREAARIALPAKGIIPRVAVTVNADDETLSRIMSEMQPDYIQCHGDETPVRLADIANAYVSKPSKLYPSQPVMILWPPWPIAALPICSCLTQSLQKTKTCAAGTGLVLTGIYYAARRCQRLGCWQAD